MKLLLGKNNRHLILPLLVRSRTGYTVQIFRLDLELKNLECVERRFAITPKRATVTTKSVH
jgi:hypothetical protein